ncbi:hypothetical protein [uncultured Paracoccus sp.]|uniref:hypothetical protein n=1 Tax=uncultured Paracoccus sp. TaxID=189685 RepID=UPI0025FA05AE|nr:hypothetical protein [uncultured Paracoccus sp.]
MTIAPHRAMPIPPAMPMVGGGFTRANLDLPVLFCPDSCAKCDTLAAAIANHQPHGS